MCIRYEYLRRAGLPTACIYLFAFATCTQVDMTWSGHVHLYHRSCPVLKGTCVGDATQGINMPAPVHIIMGHAGGSASPAVFPEQPSWSVTDIAPNFGYCTVFASRTNLSVTCFGGNEVRLLCTAWRITSVTDAPLNVLFSSHYIVFMCTLAPHFWS